MTLLVLTFPSLIQNSFFLLNSAPGSLKSRKIWISKNVSSELSAHIKDRIRVYRLSSSSSPSSITLQLQRTIPYTFPSPSNSTSPIQTQRMTKHRKISPSTKTESNMPFTDIVESRVARNSARFAVMAALTIVAVNYHKGPGHRIGKWCRFFAGDFLGWVGLQIIGSHFSKTEDSQLIWWWTLMHCSLTQRIL